jgi:hypothetical protein
MQLLSAYLPVAVGCLALLVLASKVQNYLEAQAFAQKNGTQPARKLPQWEQWVGIQNVLEMLKAAKNHGILELGLRRYAAMGKTFETKALGRSFTHTIDPENIKTVLSTNFKDFAVGQRIDTLGPLLGSGIFTTDGAAWEHSRVSYCSGSFFFFGYSSLACFPRLIRTAVGSSSWPIGTGVASGLSCTCHALAPSLSSRKRVPCIGRKARSSRSEAAPGISACDTDANIFPSRLCRTGLCPDRQQRRGVPDSLTGLENIGARISSFPDWS